MSLVARRSLVVSTAILGFMFGPVAMAQQTGPPSYLPIVLDTEGPATTVVEKGDHLWSISASHLEDRLTRAPNAAEITPYWREVIEVNQERLRSGDPDLIFPGETVVLPDSG
jgi:nucleoid-associated protein YgaU